MEVNAIAQWISDTKKIAEGLSATALAQSANLPQEQRLKVEKELADANKELAGLDKKLSEIISTIHKG